MDGEIGERTAAAAVWLVSVRLLTKSVDFVALLVLARLLTPADFGLVAIAMTLIFIVEAILELPINQALVRQPRITGAQLDTAFTLAVLRGVTLAALLALAAYPFSFIYGDARLVGLVLALGWAPVLRGLMSPRLAVYVREIDFRRDFVIDLTGKLVSLGCSIALAWQTHSYWALVFGTVVTPAIMMVMSYVVAPYRPRLTLSEWPIFASFVGWSTVTQMLSALVWQADRLILGGFATRQQLGTFTLANDLSYLPEQSLIKPIMRPLMSAFVHIGDGPERLQKAYMRASMALLAIGTPVMLGLCLLADPIVRLMLDDKWLAAIPILQWLPLSLIPPLLSAPFWSLAMAAGRPRLYTWQTLVDLVVRVALLLVGAITAGVSGVVIARIAAAVLSAISAAWCVGSITGGSVLRQFGAAWRILLASVAMSAGVFALRPLIDGYTGVALALTLASVTLAGGVIYVSVIFASWWLAGRPEGIESWCAGQVRKRLRPDRPAAFAYLLLTGDRWREWHESGELLSQGLEGNDREDLLLSGRQLLMAAGHMAGGLRGGVLVQIDLDAIGGARRIPDRVPLSGVRRFYYLRDLISPVIDAHGDSNVVPLRPHYAIAR